MDDRVIVILLEEISLILLSLVLGMTGSAFATESPYHEEKKYASERMHVSRAVCAA